MDRTRAFAVIAAFLLLAVSAERPVGRQTAASSGTAATSTLALLPAGHHQRPAAADEDTAAMAVAERLPFVAGSEAEAGELGLRGKVRERQRRTTNQQGQLAMPASTGWMQAPPPPGVSDVANDDEAAKTADTVDGEAELPDLLNPDEPWLQNYCMVDRHDFNTGSREYNHMMWRVDVCLIKFSQRRSSDHGVLCPEPSDPNDAPCGYVIVPLRGLHGHECALALRADNLDIAAFANGRNTWHVFKRYAHLIPTATVLDFDDYYNNFTGRGDEARMRVLSGTALLQSTSVISLYKKAPGTNDFYIKWALGTMAIGIPEAKRFTPVRELIVSGWLQGTTLNEVLAKNLSRW